MIYRAFMFGAGAAYGAAVTAILADPDFFVLHTGMAFASGLVLGALIDLIVGESE
jgi:hypothetical protein